MKLKYILVASLLPAFLSFFLNSLFSQDTLRNDFIYPQAFSNATATYYQAFGKQAAVYNGIQYGEYPFPLKKGWPFFNAIQPVAGSVKYDGITYDSVIISYDEVTDALILYGPGGKIQLPAEKVTRFNLYGADFIKLEKDSTGGGPVTNGFYNLLYCGTVWLLKKQVKTIKEEVFSNVELERKVEQKDHYYLKMDGRFYTIKKAKDLLSLFGDQKREVQQYIKANKLNSYDDPEIMFTRATAYYDSLKTKK